MPTLKQVQDYVKNSRHRKSVNTNGGVESSGEFASSTYSQNLNYNDNMLVNDNEYGKFFFMLVVILTKNTTKINSIRLRFDKTKSFYPINIIFKLSLTKKTKKSTI